MYCRLNSQRAIFKMSYKMRANMQALCACTISNNCLKCFLLCTMRTNELHCAFQENLLEWNQLEILLTVLTGVPVTIKTDELQCDVWHMTKGSVASPHPPLFVSTLSLHTTDNWCDGLAAARGKWVGPTLICHSSSNSPHISLSGCWELITNGNNNHKRNIIQIKDRLPKHFAPPFIILKVRGPVRHKQILRRNKDHKNQRDVLLQINIQTDRGEAKQLWEPWRISFFFF